MCLNVYVYDDVTYVYLWKGKRCECVCLNVYVYDDVTCVYLWKGMRVFSDTVSECICIHAIYIYIFRYIMCISGRESDANACV